MAKARQIPAHEQADGCSRSCVCPDCEPDLTADQRRRAGEWERRACGCFLCLEALRLRRRERLLEGL